MSGSLEEALSESVLRKIADKRVTQLGYDPSEFAVSVRRDLHQGDVAFLVESSIPDPERLSVVYYDPQPQLPAGYAQAGGDITVYVDPVSGFIAAVWLGE